MQEFRGRPYRISVLLALKSLHSRTVWVLSALSAEICFAVNVLVFTVPLAPAVFLNGSFCVLIVLPHIGLLQLTVVHSVHEIDHVQPVVQWMKHRSRRSSRKMHAIACSSLCLDKLVLSKSIRPTVLRSCATRHEYDCFDFSRSRPDAFTLFNSRLKACRRRGLKRSRSRNS